MSDLIWEDEDDPYNKEAAVGAAAGKAPTMNHQMIPLGQILRQLVPSLPAEREKQILLDAFAQAICTYHYELLKAEPAPILQTAPYALQERYRRIVKQVLCLCERDVIINGGEDW